MHAVIGLDRALSLKMYSLSPPNFFYNVGCVSGTYDGVLWFL